MADFIAQASTAFNDHVDAAVADGSLSEERAALLKDGMAERIEAMVNAEHEGRGWRKPAGKDERKGGQRSRHGLRRRIWYDLRPGRDLR